MDISRKVQLMERDGIKFKMVSLSKENGKMDYWCNYSNELNEKIVFSFNIC